MDIDLSLLHQQVVDEIKIDGSYEIPQAYYEQSDVVRLYPLNVKGIISRDEEVDHISCHAEGCMILLDSISLEEVEYPFSFEYDDFIEENCKKNENLLDILLFLWENTVLEVPLQFTKVSDLSKYHGDGWKLMSEDERSFQSNPFSELLKDYDKE